MVEQQVWLGVADELREITRHLLSGILIPVISISLFTSRSGFRWVFARLMGFFLEKSDALHRLL